MRPGSVAFVLSVALAGGCVIKTDLIGSAFNSGAIDTSGGDPFREPRHVKVDIVTRLVKAELIDGYFSQGSGPSGHRVAAWLEKAGTEPEEFWQRVVAVACGEGARIAGACEDRPLEDAGAPAPVHQQMQSAAQTKAAKAKVQQAITKWAGTPADPICTGPTRNEAALAHFVDHLRFATGVERALRAVANVAIEGLVDREAVVAGARRAFTELATYMRGRGWRRSVDHRTTGLVIKGGASTGIYSAGVAWVALHVMHECMSDAKCAATAPDPRFSLISGTSTGAFVAAAVDRFNTVKTPADRRKELDHLAHLFTCIGLNEMYCVRSRFIVDLASETSPQTGALEFDGLERILERELSCNEMTNHSELILNTVDFRSGRLFNLSDQDGNEMRTKGDVVQGVLASAVLPFIVKPISRLPVNPGNELATYLDGGIRSELPILPLVRRGAERVLVVSSSASILGESNRLENGLDIAKRYIDVSTGGVTEGEMSHAQRHAESVRFAEILGCEDMLYGDGADTFGAVCTTPCNGHALCDGRWSAETVCGDVPATRGPVRPPVERIRPLWWMKGIFRDEERVQGTHGYDFNAGDQRRLFRAGAEAARLRCTEIADLLGIDHRGRADDLVRWCSPVLPPTEALCPSRAVERGLRTCADEPSELPSKDEGPACR